MGQRQQPGPPTWFVLLLGIAFVFGIYYLWQGLRAFMATGLSVAESTQQALVENTATAERLFEIRANAPTPLPSFTPVPPCQEFVVRVPEAIVRAEPNTGSAIVGALRAGETTCVIAKLPNSEWYVIDENPLTRRLESVYMHQDIIRALYPTATFTNTLRPTVRPSATPPPSRPPPSTLPSPSPAPATRRTRTVSRPTTCGATRCRAPA